MIREYYLRLWELVHGDGIRVQYTSWTALDLLRDAQQAAGFSPQWFGDGSRPDPLIVLRHDRDRRAPGDADADGPRAEERLCLLAHEYGHALSWREAPDRYWRQLEAASSADARSWRAVLPLESRRSILAEEQRAWSHGQQVLGALGAPHLPSFHRKMTRSLELYRFHLGLELPE